MKKKRRNDRRLILFFSLISLTTNVAEFIDFSGSLGLLALLANCKSALSPIESVHGNNRIIACLGHGQRLDALSDARLFPS